LHELLGMKRFPTDNTMRNLFKRFTQGMVVRFYNRGTTEQWIKEGTQAVSKTRRGGKMTRPA